MVMFKHFLPNRTKSSRRAIAARYNLSDPAINTTSTELKVSRDVEATSSADSSCCAQDTVTIKRITLVFVIRLVQFLLAGITGLLYGVDLWKTKDGRPEDGGFMPDRPKWRFAVAVAIGSAAVAVVNFSLYALVIRKKKMEKGKWLVISLDCLVG